MKYEKSLKSRALDYLSRREMSRLELYRKLAPYAQSEEELNAVLDEFAARNWQSDTRFAEAYINSKSHKHGVLRLKQALAAKGVDSEIMQDYLPDAHTECLHATEVLRKKFRQPARDYIEKQKQMRFLLYRGFDMNTVQTALKYAWAEDNNE